MQSTKMVLPFGYNQQPKPSVMKNEIKIVEVPAGYTPVFRIYKKEAHPNGPVIICKKKGEPFDIDAKKAFYKSLGHQILPL